MYTLKWPSDSDVMQDPLLKVANGPSLPLQEILKKHFSLYCTVNYFCMALLLLVEGCLMLKPNILLLLEALRSVPADAKNNLLHFLFF